MTPRRSERELSDSSERILPLTVVETMRSKSPSAHHAEPKSGEERVSIFWRIFGGTILSISALLVITAYQSISGSIHELRTSIAQINETKSEFLKKDDYAASRQRTWDRMQEIQKEVAANAGPLTQLKDRVGQIDEQTKSLSNERKEVLQLQTSTKEKLGQVEVELMALKTVQKEFQATQQALTALQENSKLRDQQLKQAEDERKELHKEIQALRERLARVEASKEAQPTPKAGPSAVKPDKTTPPDDFN